MNKNWNGKGRRPANTYRGARRQIMKKEQLKVDRFIRKERWASYKLWEKPNAVA